MTDNTTHPTHSRYVQLIKAGAIYDLLVTTPLVLPWLVTPILQLLYQLDAALGFNTTFLPIDSTTTFLISLAGCYVSIWAFYRFLHPSRLVGRYDALLRFTLVAIQVLSVLNGATPLLLGIAGILLLIGLAQWLMAPPKALEPLAPALG